MDNKVLNGIVSRSSTDCVFFCCLLISLLQWPHCYVTTEGGWLAGPEEVIRSEFTDSLTGDIRGASFSHAQWSPGSDSTKASCLQGKSNRAREACKHLSSTNAAGTITPDTACEFTRGGTHTQYILYMTYQPACFPM